MLSGRFLYRHWALVTPPTPSREAATAVTLTNTITDANDHVARIADHPDESQ